MIGHDSVDMIEWFHRFMLSDDVARFDGTHAFWSFSPAVDSLSPRNGFWSFPAIRPWNRSELYEVQTDQSTRLQFNENNG